MSLLDNLFSSPSGGFVPNGGEPDFDLPPDYPPPDADMPPLQVTRSINGDPLCEVCGLEIPYSGRGRKPKRHKECKTGAAGAPVEGDVVDKPARASRSRAPRVSRAEIIEGDLVAGVGQTSAALTVFAPVTGVTMGLRGPAAMAALVKIAADLEARGKPQLMDGLELAVMAIPYTEVASFAGAMIYAAGVDAGRLNPDGIIAHQLGVAEAVSMIQEQQGIMPPPEDYPTGPVFNAAPDVTPPPAFQLKGR